MLFKGVGGRPQPIAPLYPVFPSLGDLEEFFLSHHLTPRIRGPGGQNWRGAGSPHICTHSQREELPAGADSGLSIVPCGPT